MTTRILHSTSPAADGGAIAQMLPNRGRAQFLRAVLLIFLAAGLLGALSVLWQVAAEFHARHSWPSAKGEILSIDQKDSKGRPGAGRRTRFWLEYQVRFAVPAEQCHTGIVWKYNGAQNPMTCGGLVRTRTTDSWSTLAGWLEHGYRRNARVTILYEPDGPGVKIAGEPVWMVYPWPGIFAMAVWMGIVVPLLMVVQKRLAYLQTLPENYSAPTTPASAPPDSGGVIDLKL